MCILIIMLSYLIVKLNNCYYQAKVTKRSLKVTKCYILPKAYAKFGNSYLTAT